MNITQVSEVSSSNAMENAGFKKSVSFVLEQGVKIDTIATDRHNTIASTMKKKFTPQNNINHQYDVWHMSKWLKKKLSKAIKTKANEPLAEWCHSITNHFWWSCKTCEGDPDLLREKWTSIIHHIVNKHSWVGNRKYHKCAHKRLTKQQMKQKKWLKAGSPAHIALQNIVFNSKFLNDMGNLTEFCHTGDIFKTV